MKCYTTPQLSQGKRFISGEKLIFQTLDDKAECVAYYINGGFTKEFDESMSHSWTAPVYLQDKQIEYAYLYAQKDIKEACPEHLKSELEECLSLMRAYCTSFVTAKLDMNQHCFYDLVPDFFLKRFCEIKNKISNYVFHTFERPENYLFLKALHDITQEISTRHLNLDFSTVLKDTAAKPTINKLRSVMSSSPYVKYNMFGSRTGRLTTRANSFPILNLNKEFRSAVQPTNDIFIELDFNAFELRVMFYLLGKEQPDIDIHQWNVENVYKGLCTREEAKRRIFSWLYNLESDDYLSERAYSRQDIINRYWDGEKIINPFGRTIQADRFHAISYLIQSTAVDIVLRQMIKVHNILKNTKSHIAFTIHDSVVIDMHKDDVNIVPLIKKEFSSLDGTSFLSSVSAGRNFGAMENCE